MHFSLLSLLFVVREALFIVTFPMITNLCLLYRNSKGNTALHVAAECGHVSTMKLLLRYHPQLINEKNTAGVSFNQNYIENLILEDSKNAQLLSSYHLSPDDIPFLCFPAVCHFLENCFAESSTPTL